MSSSSQTLQPEDLLAHLEWMHRLARALTHGDAGEAEDLAEDAVQVALADPPRLQGPVRPWLGGVLRNLARMRVRASARRRRRDATALLADGMAPSPADLAERVEAQRLVAGLVLGLEEPFRSTLLLRYYEGLSAADVARRLGVPAGTVRWRIKHALDQLRPALDRAHDGRRERWHALLLPLPLHEAAPVDGPQRARGPRTPAGGSAVTRATAKSQTIMAALSVLLLAIGAAVTAGLVRHQQARQAALAEAAARRSAGAVSRVGSLVASLLAATPADATGARAGLRLEGQVIDEVLEDPIGGATVAIDTDPPRTVITRPDGGFVLEGLPARGYRLEATRGDLYAGIAETWLSPKSDPIILRAVTGMRSRVVVRAASDGHAIDGALVTVRSILSWEGRTGSDGAVTFAGGAWGWAQVLVAAPGFAPFHRKMVPDRVDGWDIRLEAGAGVEGRVIDPQGAAVAGALVWAAPTSEMVAADDPRRDAVTTDAAGRWKMALAAGTYRFDASHPGHAQGETAPTAVDGSRPGAPVDIRLSDGGTITGEVRATDGRPLASVLVRAAEKITFGPRFPREALTDGSGRFRFQGLPRRVIELVAISTDGSSPIAAVDLQTGAPERPVVLVASNDQLIAGTVVDGAGRPVGEAQVVAGPASGSLWGPGEDQLRLDLHFISDGGGHFRFAGLPAGDYRLRAAPRAGSDLLSPVDGVPAKPGDRNVRIVVPGRGSVKGTVLYEDGRAPPRFGVTVGTVTREFLGDKGSFTIEVPAGHADLILRGIRFLNQRVGAVDVAEGKTTDVGVIRVKDGRDVRGRVLRADGTPVAGADVTAGPWLSGDGRKVKVAPDVPALETRSGADGRYTMGLADTDLVLVADSPGLGRSRVVQIPRGELSRDIDLILAAPSTLGGVVSRAGQPLPHVPVFAAPRFAPHSQFAVMSGPDGRYQFDVLAPGPYRVQVEDGAGTVRPRGAFSNSVTIVEAGQGQERSARLDIDIPVGPFVLTVDVRTEQGDAVPGARIEAVTGRGEGVSSLKELYQLFDAAPDGPASHRTGWEQPAGTSISIADLLPGTYTICTAPSWIPPRRPETDQDPVRCLVQRLDSSQNVSLAIPADWVRR